MCAQYRRRCKLGLTAFLSLAAAPLGIAPKTEASILTKAGSPDGACLRDEGAARCGRPLDDAVRGTNDLSAVLPDGTRIDSPQRFREVLLKGDEFVTSNMEALMRVRITRYWSGLCLVGLLATPSVGMAAEADPRLVHAAAQQDTPSVRALLTAGADVDTRQPDGATALHWAAHWNDLQTADLLLTADADVNAANDHGVTPLALACENASMAMVERLVRAGANPNLAQVSGLTPLMIAARTGNATVVEALLARGATVNASVQKTGHSALMWAVGEGHHEIVRLLVARGAEVDARAKTGFTPLLFAARNGNIEIAKVLIAAGAGVNHVGSDGTHALPLAVLNLQDQFALFLLEQGADPNGRLHGVPALHLAAGDVTHWIREWTHPRGVGPRSHRLRQLDSAHRVTLVKALLARGADPNGRITTSTVASANHTLKGGAFNTFAVGTGDMKGATPLWVAAWTLRDRRSGSPDVIRSLLAAGADVHLATADQTTPLMVAAGLGRRVPGGGAGQKMQRGPQLPLAEAGLQILVEAGADVNTANEAGFTALHGAAFIASNEMIEYLVKQGADINAQQFQGQTAFRLAQGSGSFEWHTYPGTAELLAALGTDTTLGVDPETLYRRRDVALAPEQQGPLPR